MDALDHAKRLVSRAALSLASWEEAVCAVAAATGGQVGQLISLGMRGDLRFNIMTGVDPAALEEFNLVGGGDPYVNSRVRAGMLAPEMDWFGDALLTPEQDAARSPAFADWINRNQLGQCRLINLVKKDGGLVGAGVVRDPSQDGFSSLQLTVLSELGGAMRNAVMTQMIIEGDQAAIVAGSFDEIGRAVFVCGRDGRIVASSASAERLLSESRWLTSRGQYLIPTNQGFARQFSALMFDSSMGRRTAGVSDDAMVLRDADGAPLLVRMHRFPDADPFRLTKMVLVIPCVAEGRKTDLSRMAAQLFDLTPTEALVLAHIASGRKPDTIAQLMGIMPSTVRSHLKRVFSKTDTNSQLEVSVLLMGLI
ncbi:helix-turn-helix transcriptional regulator [Erythrobacter sp.]|uniref:helix-turn-helix transcriptional regulator n=1 Tax=Erythrobacter sp. TaxID=1042 RepID=UPI0025D13C60|nr:helix-turn-helix transcriptional regulator [Erythrobacter sp.]